MGWWGTRADDPWSRPAIVQIVKDTPGWLGGAALGLLVTGLYQAKLGDWHPSWTNYHVWRNAALPGIAVAVAVAFIHAPYKQRNGARTAYRELWERMKALEALQADDKLRYETFAGERDAEAAAKAAEQDRERMADEAAHARTQGGPTLGPVLAELAADARALRQELQAAVEQGGQFVPLVGTSFYQWMQRVREMWPLSHPAHTAFASRFGAQAFEIEEYGISEAMRACDFMIAFHAAYEAAG
jgi:hypothetical protein